MAVSDDLRERVVEAVVLGGLSRNRDGGLSRPRDKHEPISRQTPGAVASPTKWATRPMCMNRMAAICATSPDRPWPEKNQRREGSLNLSTTR